jgi:hypothetical protein
MAKDEDAKKTLLRRQSRHVPTDHVALIEFFLNTQADDMEVQSMGWRGGVGVAGWHGRRQASEQHRVDSRVERTGQQQL